jgi:ParB-like chromosome segregation protein Spo0J
MIEEVSIYSLSPQKTTNTVEMEDILELVESIKRVGIIRPITVDSSYKIIDGDIRFLAANMLKIERITVDVILKNSDMFLQGILIESGYKSKIKNVFSKRKNI